MLYLIIIMLLILFGLLCYGMGVNHGTQQRKSLSDMFTREIKTNIKADRISDVLIGEGEEPDTLEPDDFERKKQEQPIMTRTWF